MSEQSTNNPDRLQVIQNGVDRAAEIIGGGNPLEIFPDPADKERRADVVWGAELSEDQQIAFRGVMAELGPGRRHNIGPDEAGLSNGEYSAVFEGGQPHKMIAQFNVVDQAQSQPGRWIASGTTGRVLGEAEKENAARLLAINKEEVADTEAGVAEQIVRSRPGFEAVEEEVIDETDLHTRKLIGTINGAPAEVLQLHRVPREGTPYDQHNNQAKMGLFAQESSQVAIVTSSTYQPSNEVAALLVTEDNPQVEAAAVLSYGTEELAAVKGEEPGEPSIAQLGAEAFKTAKLVAQENK